MAFPYSAPDLDSTLAGLREEEGKGGWGQLTLIIHANVEQPTTGVNLNRESRAAPRPALSWFHGGITGQIEFKGAASSLHLLQTNTRNYGHCSGRVVALLADLAATVSILYTRAFGIYAFAFLLFLIAKLYFYSAFEFGFPVFYTHVFFFRRRVKLYFILDSEFGFNVFCGWSFSCVQVYSTLLFFPFYIFF